MFPKFKKKLVKKIISKCTFGDIKVIFPDKTFVACENNNNKQIIFEIFDWSVISNMATQGDVGLAKDYRDGKWVTNDLKNLIIFAINNENVLSEVMFSNSFFTYLLKLQYFFKKNSIKQAKKNIADHYDISNDFYKIWLDNTMTYSSGIYDTKNTTLEQAQINKYQKIINNFKDSKKDKVLEIGCGWGGFFSYASNFFKEIDSITISKEQFNYSSSISEKIDNVNVGYLDYRDVKGKYDLIVSIEMFEAVGQGYWDTYFKKVNDLLVKGGKAVIQTITIRDDLFDNYSSNTDAIRSLIFPGGMLPSPSKFIRYAQDNGLKVINKISFGKSYSKTLDEWHKRFKENINIIKNQSLDDRFIRLWEYYLLSCSAGFESNRTDVYQFTLEKE